MTSTIAKRLNAFSQNSSFNTGCDKMGAFLKTKGGALFFLKLKSLKIMEVVHEVISQGTVV